jgi:hypothetical protein
MWICVGTFVGDHERILGRAMLMLKLWDNIEVWAK